MTDDKKERVFRKLSYYYENKLSVYFKVIDNRNGKLLFRIGKILNLNLNHSTLIINEKVLGEQSILFEDIVEESITLARQRGV